MTMSNPVAKTEGPCLVCGHSAADHSQETRVCAGVGGLCQCHAYNPHEHPVQRLAARRRANAGGVADPGGTPDGGLGDIGSSDQERLQAAMDQRAATMGTLSNIEKTVSDTSAALTTNLK